VNVFGKVKNFINAYIPSMPDMYWIDITNHCNLRCIMCPQSGGGFKRESEMSMNMFKSIIDDVCENSPLIKLYMTGEPLLHNGLFDMIEYASNKGCKTMVHTNATLLTEQISFKLLSSSLTYLSFSFDGCTSEVYERLRPPAKFNKVKSNIIKYLDLKTKIKTHGPHTTIEIIKMKDTDELIKEFAAQWENSGVDKISVADYMTWLDSVNDRRVETQCNNGYKPCWFPFNYGCILSDGTVVPCCLDVFGKMPLGNITNNSFREIWFGEQFELLRKHMIAGQIQQGSICDGCYKTFCRSRIDRLVLSVPRFLALLKTSLL